MVFLPSFNWLYWRSSEGAEGDRSSCISWVYISDLLQGSFQHPHSTGERKKAANQEAAGPDNNPGLPASYTIYHVTAPTPMPIGSESVHLCLCIWVFLLPPSAQYGQQIPCRSLPLLLFICPLLSWHIFLSASPEASGCTLLWDPDR